MIQATNLPIKNACKTLEVSRQAFYKWEMKSPAQDTDKMALEEMQEIALEFPKYGYRRITKELHTVL